jgi:hypothetical protein
MTDGGPALTPSCPILSYTNSMWPRVSLRDDPSPAFAPLGGAGTVPVIEGVVRHANLLRVAFEPVDVRPVFALFALNLVDADRKVHAVFGLGENPEIHGERGGGRGGGGGSHSIIQRLVMIRRRFTILVVGGYLGHEADEARLFLRRHQRNGETIVGSPRRTAGPVHVDVHGRGQLDLGSYGNKSAVVEK